MSLGKMGLTGGLGDKKTVANMILYGSDHSLSSAGGKFSKLTGGINQGATDNRFGTAMPYAGSFEEFRFKSDGLWRGQVWLQKNNVDTILTLSFDPPSTAIKKIKAKVEFVAGDVFRYRMTVTGNGGIAGQYSLLFGGLNVTN